MFHTYRRDTKVQASPVGCRWAMAAAQARSIHNCQGIDRRVCSHSTFHDEVQTSILGDRGIVIQAGNFKPTKFDLARREFSRSRLPPTAEAVRLEWRIFGIHPLHAWH